ncbi:MAG: integrase core domain-containing protein [Gemmatimonadota bacterium]|nr:integrase core domain-containing protein [Gemmatimonadota bacterium]
MSERRRFIDEYLRGTASMTVLCASYGISRRVGYKWLTRFLVEGDRALEDRSRRPRTSPWAIAPDVATLLLTARRRHPTWGPRKILDYLRPRHRQLQLPAPSTAGALFKRHGLVRPKRRRPQPGHPGRPTSPILAPNDVWTADFKGHFALGCGLRCHPLTIVDGYSRFLLACDALRQPTTPAAKAVFTRVFQEYGLPDRVRTDNGAPFASIALNRLSTLSVWWMKLGIRPELIEPASPQQNARHERLHRTLKAEATKPPKATIRAQQRRFNTFRTEYNTERPHEAPQGKPPAAVYRPAQRVFPGRIPGPEYPSHYLTRYVSTNGGVRFHRRFIAIAPALIGEHVGFEEVADGRWAVYFYNYLLGHLDEREGHIHGVHLRAKPVRSGN